MKSILTIFSLREHKEDVATTIANIRKGVVFKGTNLWILIFAIIVASVGLNINSTAVVIGAMLISPLMGPIMGVGLGLGINDLELVKNSMRNLGFAVAAALAASAVYFSLSPISEAHSELLARTTPAIWDVLIAFFGGIAGIVANSSKEKGTVLPGVAIATALMPPLCTAGFGLAHHQWAMFGGAIYLFVINGVFISVATFLFVRLQKFPLQHYSDPRRETMVKRWVLIIVLATLGPSIYMAYHIVGQERFNVAANSFIANETTLGDNYLLNNRVDAPNRVILLTYGGQGLTEAQKNNLRKQLVKYNLTRAKLDITEGFSMRSMAQLPDRNQQYITTIDLQQREISKLTGRLDSIRAQTAFDSQLVLEAKAIRPELVAGGFSRFYSANGNNVQATDSLLAYFRFSKKITSTDKRQLDEWLSARINNKRVRIVAER